MISSRHVSPARCVAVGGAATAVCGGLVAWLLPTALASGAGTFEAALVRLCAVLAVLAAGWLWLVATLTVVEAVRGRDHDSTGVSGVTGLAAPVRRAVLAACGVALAGGLATGTAHATPGRLHEDRTASAASAVAGLPLPDRATARPTETVVVAPGDSLWAIAARLLGPGATDAEIDASWRLLYDLNRTAIGADPDVIHPAQRLEVLP